MSNKISGYVLGCESDQEMIFNHVKNDLTEKMNVNLKVSHIVYDHISKLINDVRSEIEEYGEVVSENLLADSEKEVDVLIKDLIMDNIGGKVMLNGTLVSVSLKSEDINMIEKSLLSEDENHIFFSNTKPVLENFLNNINFKENEISDGVGVLKILPGKIEFSADIPYEKADAGILYKTFRNSMIELSRGKPLNGMILIKTSAGIKEDVSFGNFSNLISAAKMKNIGSQTLDKLWSAIHDKNEEVANRPNKMKLK